MILLIALGWEGRREEDLVSSLTSLLNRSVPVHHQLPLEIPLEIPLHSDEAGHPSLPTRSGFSEFSNRALLKLEQKVFAFPDAVLLTSCMKEQRRGKALRTGGATASVS